MRSSDWSSDVCSSDLVQDAAETRHIAVEHILGPVSQRLGHGTIGALAPVVQIAFGLLDGAAIDGGITGGAGLGQRGGDGLFAAGSRLGEAVAPRQIVRAAGRERVCSSVENPGV